MNKFAQNVIVQAKVCENMCLFFFFERKKPNNANLRKKNPQDHGKDAYIKISNLQKKSFS